MADSNTQAFRLANTIFNDAVVNGAAMTAQQFRDEVDRFLKRYMRNFYSMMIRRMGDYSGGWDPLTEKTLLNKKSRGSAGYGFLRDRISLLPYLENRNAANQFGNPIVSFGDVTEGLSDIVRRDSAGRIQFRRGAVPTGFRPGFAPARFAVERLTFSLTIMMYPKLQGSALSGFLSREVSMSSSGSSISANPLFQGFGSVKQRKKFAAFNMGRRFRGKLVQQPRPLLAPFLGWYGTTNLRSAFSQEFKVNL